MKPEHPARCAAIVPERPAVTAPTLPADDDIPVSDGIATPVRCYATEPVGPARSSAVSAVDLANLVDAAPDGLLLVDGHGIIRHANRRIESLFGYDPDELVGQTVEVLLPEHLRSVHLVRRDRYRASPTIRTMGSGLDLRGRRRDGTLILVEVSLSPIEFDGAPAVVAAVRDVSARVEADAHVRRIERLVDRAHEGVYLIDPITARFTYVNAGAAAQSGYGRQALLSMTPLELMPDMDSTILQRVLERVATRGRLVPIVTRLRRADGEDLPVELLVERDESPGGAVAVAALVRDLSERRQSEEMLDETREELALVEDRERIARDLHDRIIQRLFAIGMSLQASAGQVPEGTAFERLGRSIDDIDDTIREIRAVIFELQPPTPSGSLRRQLLTAVRETRSVLGFEPHVVLSGPLDSVVGPSLAAELLAVVEAGLANVAAYAKPTAVEVRVTAERTGMLSLELDDDGLGIPELIEPGRDLAGFAVRAEEIGGTLRIERQVGRTGTRLSWQAPLQP